MTLGPVMLDVTGLRVTPEEKEVLRHPSVGSVILFARNFESPRQLSALTAEIRGLRRPELLIAVDHEGGRVQRFQEGFTRISPMRSLGERWEIDAAEARALAEATGYVMPPRPGPSPKRRATSSRWSCARTESISASRRCSTWTSARAA